MTVPAGAGRGSRGFAGGRGRLRAAQRLLRRVRRPSRPLHGLRVRRRRAPGSLPGGAVARTLATLAAALLLALALSLGGAHQAVLVPALFSVVFLLPSLRWPDGPWSTAACLLLATTYLGGAVRGRVAPTDVVVVLSAAACLYLVHASLALAGRLPPGCDTDPAVLRRWAGRTGAVLGVALPVGAGVLLLTGSGASPVLQALGLIAALGLAALPAVLLGVAPAWPPSRPLRPPARRRRG